MMVSIAHNILVLSRPFYFLEFHNLKKPFLYINYTAVLITEKHIIFVIKNNVVGLN